MPRLDSLLPRTRQLILAETLIGGTDRPVYLSDLARRLGVPPSSLQRELRALVAAGILVRHEDGNRVYFAANERCPLLPELRGLLFKTAGIAKVLAEELEPLRTRIDVAFIFGSVARGTEHSESDVDLFVVGEPSLLELTPVLRAAEDRLGRPVNVVPYTATDLRERLARGDHFPRSVLGQKKLFVIGGTHELEQVAQGRPG
jgi:predicted nucleotidyltransferase